MIQVENVTKWYGSTKAVDDVSFSVKKGAIVGFLGPNGAGKTTTMRILCGSLGANQGRAMVGGIDVLKEPRKVKQMLGYLPEHPPLYTDMTVRGYLRFCARIKGAAKPREAVERVIRQVGLSPMAHKLIDHLSKGYRQRVGIAQALVHDPAVLVLDEPGSGLDPKQWAEIRDLIKDLAGGDTTVLLSSHILLEIEEICAQVVIISNGKVAAQGTVDELVGSAAVAVRVAAPKPELLQKLTALEQVTGVEDAGEGEFIVQTTADVRTEIARVAVDYGLLEFGTRRRLEDVFLKLTETTGGPS